MIIVKHVVPQVGRMKKYNNIESIIAILQVFLLRIAKKILCNCNLQSLLNEILEKKKGRLL